MVIRRLHAPPMIKKNGAAGDGGAPYGH